MIYLSSNGLSDPKQTLNYKQKSFKSQIFWIQILPNKSTILIHYFCLFEPVHFDPLPVSTRPILYKADLTVSTRSILQPPDDKFIIAGIFMHVDTHLTSIK
jgi:hypothetical protein